MPVNFSDFEKMPAEKRAKELNSLIETLKKEIENAKKDLSQKEKDLSDAQEFLAKSEKEARVLEDVRTQGLEKKAQEEKQETTGATKKQARSLEEELEGAPRMKAPEGQSYFANKTLADIDKITTTIYQRQKQTGIETETDRRVFYEASKELEDRRRKLEEGSYIADRDTRKHLEHAEDLVKKDYEKHKEQYKRHAL
jgi:hypothetical protein